MRRSPRRGFFERVLLRLVFVSPWRCRDCRYRFYAFLALAKSQETDSAVEHSAKEAQANAVPEAGQERRSSRRVAMRTWVRIRTESGSTEVVEPVDISRGGLSFESTRQYDLNQTVWVTPHYDPNIPDSGAVETRSLIVRADPLPRWNAHSYSVKFQTG